MTTVTLEFNMAEINTIRNAITTKLIVTEDNKRRFKNGLNKPYSIAQKCALHEEIRECNDTLSMLRGLEHKIDAFIRNQTGEDM
ncbi:MAG: hypothetical protein EBT02_08045 [Planctomycetia bacterium]|nr:hypothetical protein [Planctomycetia bacterium]